MAPKATTDDFLPHWQLYFARLGVSPIRVGRDWHNQHRSLPDDLREQAERQLWAFARRGPLPFGADDAEEGAIILWMAFRTRFDGMTGSGRLPKTDLVLALSWL